MAFKQSKDTKYSSKEDIDELEHLAEKLALDLRKNIKQLGNFPILSKDWVTMAETFGRLANISDMESKLAGSKEDKTLWETEEQALRFLLEDGKLNLCLRNMIEYKNLQRTNRQEGYSGPLFDNQEVCDKFEKGLGVILKNAWNHVEAIQTTDLYALILHISDVLQSSLQHPEVMDTYCRIEDIHQRQEVLIFWYLNSIMTHVDSIHEERIMPMIRERRMFIQGVEWITKYYSSLLSVNIIKVTEALALIVDTDDFKTYRDDYITDAKDARLLQEYKRDCIDKYLSEFPNKKLIRPLLDATDRSRRKYL